MSVNSEGGQRREPKTLPKREYEGLQRRRMGVKSVEQRALTQESPVVGCCALKEMSSPRSVPDECNSLLGTPREVPEQSLKLLRESPLARFVQVGSRKLGSPIAASSDAKL